MSFSYIASLALADRYIPYDSQILYFVQAGKDNDQRTILICGEINDVGVMMIYLISSPVSTNLINAFPIKKT